MIYTGENEYPIYLGDSEISAIYAGEELIYPVNLGTVTGITLENLTWKTDVPYSGGTADAENCTFKVVAHYDSGKSRSVTSKATITGSLTASASTSAERTDLGLLTLTASYEGFTATASVEAYQEANHYNQYLTFKITSPGKIVWNAGSAATVFKTIQYSMDSGSTWTSITSAKNAASYIDVVAGDIVMFKGENTGYGSSINYASSDFMNSTAGFTAEGNIMSLLYGDNFVGQTTLPSAYTFRGLFSNIGLTGDASNIILPATVMTEQGYRNLFAGTNIVTPPKLPAMTLAPYCYCNMFINAKQLEVAPDLLAPVLVEGCYTGMLHIQGSMTEAQKKLRYCRCLAIDISARNCVTNFFNNTNVASNGVFVKAASNNSWSRGSNGIPTSWTIVNEEA